MELKRRKISAATCALWMAVALPAGAGDQGRAAGEIVNLEDGTGQVAAGRWAGASLPEPTEYSPAVGAARHALRFAGAGEAHLPLQADLGTARVVAVRLSTAGQMELSISMKSGPGRFAAAISVEPGEQVLLVPVAAFDRIDNPSGWDEIDGLTITFPSSARRTPVDLLGVQACPDGVSVPGDDIFLLRAVSGLHRIGRAWPLYAVLSETDYMPGETYPPKWRGIVTADSAPSVLRRCMEEMLGATLPFNPEGVEIEHGMKNVVLLGREAALKAGVATGREIAGQGYFGFIVRADDGALVIAGETRHGDNFGAHRYLERQGCRFYSYNPTVCHVPAQKERTLKVWTEEDKPFFEYQSLGGPYFWGVDSAMGNAGWTKEAKDKSLFPDGMNIRREHTAGFLVPPARYRDDHPEYFALLGHGERMAKDVNLFRTRVCTTHPDVLRISAERTLKWIEQQPGYKYFAVDQGDDWEWCQCERCKAMEYEEGNASDRMLYWVNHVARAVAGKYPDKIIYCLAYGPTQPAPVKIKPEDNVRVLYCAWPSRVSAPNQFRNFDDADNYLARHEIMGWLDIMPGRVGLYDYHAYGRYTLNGMVHRQLWAARHGMHFGFWYSGINQSFRHLFSYVSSKMNWNPLQDVDRLKGEFIRGYYGEAAPEMEKIIRGIYDRIEYGDYSGGVPGADFFTPEFTGEMLALFDRAIDVLDGERGVGTDRDYFVNNGVRATAPGRGEVSEEQMETFAMLLQRYLTRWIEVYEGNVAAARKKGVRIPGIGSLRTGLWYSGIVDNLWIWASIRVEPPEEEGSVPEIIKELLADPVGAIRRHRVTEFVERVENGWRIPAEAFMGGAYRRSYGWRCEPKPAVLVRGARTGISRMAARFDIDEGPPSGEGVLDVLGQACDKMWAPHVPIEITLNGERVFVGVNDFAKQGWSRKQFPVPAGAVRKGENILEVHNLSDSDSVVSHWFMVSEALLMFP